VRENRSNKGIWKAFPATNQLPIVRTNLVHLRPAAGVTKADPRKNSLSFPNGLGYIPKLRDETFMTTKLFSDLGLSAEVLKAIDNLGFEQASPIQAAAIPLLMAGKDIVGQSQLTRSSETSGRRRASYNRSAPIKTLCCQRPSGQRPRSQQTTRLRRFGP
jgi:hypothetical protein